MAIQIQHRRGTTTQHTTFTGASGEITVDTTKNTAVVHDGSTAGGVPLARESDVTLLSANLDADIYGSEINDQRSRLKYSATSLSVVEDFSNQQSGWAGSSKASAGTVGSIPVRTLAADGASQTISTYKTFSSPITIYTNCIFDVYVTNKPNVASFFIWLVTSSGNRYSFTCTSDFIVEGVNHVNVPGTVVGSPSKTNITSIQLSLNTNANGAATASFAKIETYDRKAMCTLWFDDETPTAYSVAFPAMSTLGMSGAMSVITHSVGLTSFMTRAQLSEMQSKGWDLCNHTHNHYDLTSIPIDQAEFEIRQGKEYLHGMNVRNSSNYLALPLGNTNTAVTEVAKKYASVIRLAGAADTTITSLSLPQSQYWFKVPVRSVSNNITVDTVKGWIDEAIAKQKWLILLFHHIVTPADTTLKYTPDDFQTIINYLDANKSSIKVVTPTEAITSI